MPADFWSDDDRPQSPPRPRWRWWHVTALVLVILLVLFGFAAAIAPNKLAGGWIGWQVRQIKKDILSGKLSPEQLRDELRAREGGHHLALRLSEDEDPRVRAAVVGALAGWGRPATRREPRDPDLLPGNRLYPDDEEAMKRLLADPDPAVRRATLRAVSAIEEARGFEDELLRVLGSGPADERVIVAEHLAHWNGRAARRTFADPKQPKEVRLAALKGTEKYGWAEVVRDDEDFVRTMKLTQADPDADIRRAAAEALTHAPK
jgi:hypothetical protein